MGPGDDPYADLAAEYHWLYDPFSLRVGTRTPGVQAAIRRLPDGARVLDAACGIGLDALSLHRRGYRVTATDASPAMVRECRRRLAAESVPTPVAQCPWADLPDRFGAEFDAVLCTGNSLAHAPTTPARREALTGFARVLVPGGTVILDSQDWPVIHARGSRRDDDPLVLTRDGSTCRRTFDWRVPDHFGDPLVLEIALTLDGSRHSSYDVVFRPFTAEDLVEDLQASGFGAVDVLQDPDDDRLAVTAVRDG